jgi:hypothetical protein
MDGVDEAVFLRRTPNILVRAVGTAETPSSADGRVRREMINSPHPAQRTSDFAASRAAQSGWPRRLVEFVAQHELGAFVAPARVRREGLAAPSWLSGKPT